MAEAVAPPIEAAYAQLDFLILAAMAALVLLALGVLRLMDWMIAMSERPAGHR